MAKVGTTGVARDYRATAYFSFLGALLFFVSSACFLSGAVTEYDGRKNAPGGFAGWSALNTSSLGVIWESRRHSEGAYLAAEATGALAWFSLMPAVDAMSAMAGERSASKLLRSCFAAVAIITVVDFTFQAGLVQMTDWMSTWNVMRDADHAHDGGFGALQALEIAYQVTASRTLWLFAMDELLLAIGWATAAFLVYTGAGRTHTPMSRCWAHFSAFGALLAFVGTILNLARAGSFMTFALPASVTVALIYLLVMPVWLCSLGVQLKNRSDPAGLYQASTPAGAGAEMADVEAGGRSGRA